MMNKLKTYLKSTRLTQDERNALCREYNKKHNTGSVNDIYILSFGGTATILSFIEKDIHGMNHYNIVASNDYGKVERRTTKYHLDRGTVPLPTPDTLVQGRGYNSKGFISNPLEAVFRVKWNTMLERTNPRNVEQYPTYHDVTVDPLFYDFVKFMDHIYELCENMGVTIEDALKAKLDLDKDILGDGKEYGPGKICLVPRSVNMMFRSFKDDRICIRPGKNDGSGRVFYFNLRAFDKRMENNVPFTTLGIRQAAVEINKDYHDMIKFIQTQYKKLDVPKDPRVTELFEDSERLLLRLANIPLDNIPAIEHTLKSLLVGEPELDFLKLPSDKVSVLTPCHKLGIWFDLRHTSNEKIRKLTSITQWPKYKLYGASLREGVIRVIGPKGKAVRFRIPKDDEQVYGVVKQASENHIAYKANKLKAEFDAMVSSGEDKTLTPETVAVINKPHEELIKLQGHTEDKLREFVAECIEHRNSL